jgi:hypothetical protein
MVKLQIWRYAMDSLIKIDLGQVRSDYKSSFAGLLPEETINAISDQLNALSTAVEYYAATAVITPLKLVTEAQVTVKGGEVFNGIAGGRLLSQAATVQGQIGTADISTLYKKATAMLLFANSDYSSLTFSDGQGVLLGLFLGGGIAGVTNPVRGVFTGKWG